MGANALIFSLILFNIMLIIEQNKWFQIGIKSFIWILMLNRYSHQ